MKELKKQLKSICPFSVRIIKKPKKSNRKHMGYCRPWQDSIIRILPLSKIDHEEVTLYHEWFHLYQYKVDKDCFYFEEMASRYVVKGSYPHDSNSLLEEEADAFALLLAKRSKEYDMDDIDTRLWLSFMWRHLWYKYRDLKPLLVKHRFTASSGFYPGDDDGDC